MACGSHGDLACTAGVVGHKNGRAKSTSLQAVGLADWVSPRRILPEVPKRRPETFTLHKVSLASELSIAFRAILWRYDHGSAILAYRHPPFHIRFPVVPSISIKLVLISSGRPRDKLCKWSEGMGARSECGVGEFCGVGEHKVIETKYCNAHIPIYLWWPHDRKTSH